MMDFFKQKNKTFAIGFYFNKTTIAGDCIKTEIGLLIGKYAVGLTF